MNIVKALFEGIRSVNRSIRYIFVVYFINLAIAVVFGLVLADTIMNSLGSSLAGNKLLDGFDGLWYNSFSQQAAGLAASFDPSVTGIGAIFNGLDSLLSGNLFHEYPGIVGAGVIYLILWTYFSAGFIAVYAADGERPSFIQQGTRFFPRFAILAVLAGALYFLTFHFIMDWLSGAVDALTRETIDERIHFAYTAGKYAVLWLLIWLINLLFYYGKIIIVLQDHHNILTAPFRALFKAPGTVFLHFPKTFGLYVLTGLFWVVLTLLYCLIAPGAGGPSLAVIFAAFALGQFYLMCRIWIHCLFYAGQTTLCKSLYRADQAS